MTLLSYGTFISCRIFLEISGSSRLLRPKADNGRKRRDNSESEAIHTLLRSALEEEPRVQDGQIVPPLHRS